MCSSDKRDRVLCIRGPPFHHPSLASQTQLTPARIAFSITHGEGRVVHVDTEGDPRWSWLGLAHETNSYRDVIEQQVNFLVRKRLWLQSA